MDVTYNEGTSASLACAIHLSRLLKERGLEDKTLLVLEKAEFPEEAQAAFRGYEVNGNPWQLPAEERGNWAEGLDIPLVSGINPLDFSIPAGAATGTTAISV